MIHAINRLFHLLAEAPIRLAGTGGLWGALLICSLASAVLGLVVFKYCSRQQRLRRIKSRLFACILEIRVYQDDLSTVFRALGALLAGTGRYLIEALLPVAVLIVPIGLWLGHLAHTFEWRPIRPGEATVVSVTLAPTVDLRDVQATMALPPGIEGDSTPFASRRSHALLWRIRAAQPVSGLITVTVNGATSRKTIRVSDNPAPVYPRKVPANAVASLWAGAEDPLPPAGPIMELTVAYPRREWHLGTMTVNWVAVFVILTVLMGYALKHPLNVEF